jgi:hypothetical protein
MASIFDLRHRDTVHASTRSYILLKKIFQVVLCIQFIAAPAKAQFCSTVSDATFRDIHTFFSATGNRTVKIYYHVIRDDVSSNSPSLSDINSWIDSAEDVLFAGGIILDNSCSRYLSTIVNPQMAASPEICPLRQYCFTDGLNVFLTPNGRDNRGGEAMNAGNICWVRLTNEDEVGSLVHEIGHTLGLFHTTHGRPWVTHDNSNGDDWTCQDGFDRAFDIIRRQNCQGQNLTAIVDFELVDGSNAQSSGDFVDDTNAAFPIGSIECPDSDPFCGPTCVSDYLNNDDRRKDPNCDVYQVEIENVMWPQSVDCRDLVLTTGQFSRMKGIIDAYLTDLTDPSLIPVVATTVSTTSVEVTWDAIASFDSYTVRYRPIGSSTWTIVNNVSSADLPLTLTNLQPTTTYSVEVEHDLNAGCQLFQSITVGTSCVPVNDFVLDQLIYAPTEARFGGDIIIKNGGTLVIESGNTIYMGEGTSIVVEEGGQLILEQYAGILPCDESWEQLVVHGSIDAQGYQNRLYGLKDGVRIEPGATASLLQIDIEGTGEGNTGLYLGSNSDIQLSDQIKVAGYNTAIEADNVGSYLDFSSTRINQCRYGIRLDETPAAITDANIESYAVGIIASNSPGCLIEDNDINSIASSDPSFIGTSFDRYGSIYMFRAGGSILRYNTLGTPETEQRYGIILIDSYGGTIDQFNSVYANQIGVYGVSTDFRISQNNVNYLGSDVTAQFSGSGMGGIRLVAGNGNQVNNNYVTASNYADYGISTVTSQGTEISNNEVDFDVLCCDDRSAAINSLGSNDETVRQNYVSGSRGVLANNTAGNTYECNVISHTHNFPALGILYNSLGQRIRDNSLESDADDLIIRSAIGEQHHHGNTFSGAGERVFAEDDDIAFQSRFYVNSGIPFHMPMEVDPAGWFRDETLVYNHYECAQSPGQGPNWIPFWDGDGVICSYYNKVVEDHGYDSRQYIRMIQTMLRYDKQRSDFSLSDCIIGDPVLPECWDKLTQAEKLLLDRHKDEEGSSEGSDALAELVEGVSAAYKVDSTASIYVLQHQDELVALTNQEREKQLQNASKIQVAEELLTEVDCSDSIIAVVLPIMLEYVKYLQTEEKDTFDYSTLITYSRYCADDYGPYIHLARALVSPYTDEIFASYDDCRTPVEERSRATVADAQATIYPNPSTGNPTLDFGRDRSGHIIVRDISGMIVLMQKFAEQVHAGLVLDKVGLYLVQVAYTDGEVETIKHIVTQ